MRWKPFAIAIVLAFPQGGSVSAAPDDELFQLLDAALSKKAELPDSEEVSIVTTTTPGEDAHPFSCVVIASGPETDRTARLFIPDDMKESNANAKLFQPMDKKSAGSSSKGPELIGEFRAENDSLLWIDHMSRTIVRYPVGSRSNMFLANSESWLRSCVNRYRKQL
jgi:hypothetical protein